MTKRSNDAFVSASSVAEQALSGVRTVYAFSLQNRFSLRYGDSLRRVEQADRRKSFVLGLSTGAFNCLLFLIFAFGFWWAGRMVAKGDEQGTNVVVCLSFRLSLGLTR